MFSGQPISIWLVRAFGPETWAGWALVATGIWAAIIAIRTLRAILHEAEIAKDIAGAAQDNAAAAKASVDALVNSDRAWIAVTIGQLPELPQPSDSLSVLWVMPIVQNYGKTPARVRKVWGKVQQFAAGAVPAEPVYEAPNCSFEADIVLPPGIPIQPLRLGMSNVEYGAAITEIRSGAVVLYMYGYIDYQDVANRLFQTRFCYVYQIQAGYNPMPSGFYMGGPPAYNKAS
jgi:hypothetical protein